MKTKRKRRRIPSPAQSAYMMKWKLEHLPLLVINYPTTCMICDHRHTNQLLAHLVTHGSESLASRNHQQSFGVWYISSSRLLYVALLSLGGISACLLRVALLFILLLLLQHTNNVSFPHQPFHQLHMTRCTLWDLRRLLLLNIASVRSPFPPFLPLNISIETNVSHFYNS